MITYQEEIFEDIIEEIKPIIITHWKEIEINKDNIKLDCDWDRYIQLDELGMLSTVSVRSDGVLIGYITTFIIEHLHYKTHTFADVDAMYIALEYRGTGIGRELCNYAEDICKDKGVSIIMQHVKLTHNFGSLLEGIGYTKVEEMYSKYIGEK